MDVDNNFTISDVGTKCKSKSEFYNVLTTERRLYLPPKWDWTQNFLRQLMIGKKKDLHNDDVKVINVAQIKGLRVPQLLLFASSKLDIDAYLQEYDYAKKPNRSWLANLIDWCWINTHKNLQKVNDKWRLEFTCVLQCLLLSRTAISKSQNNSSSFLQEIHEASCIQDAASNTSQQSDKGSNWNRFRMFMDVNIEQVPKHLEARIAGSVIRCKVKEN